MDLRRFLLPAVLATVLTGATVPVAAVAAPAAAAPAAATGFTFIDIKGDGGVTLKANVISPTAPGPHPALIFPSSWGLNDLEYLAQAKILANDGYIVVSYTPRGWWASGGEIDVAGPKDVADLSKVLDWTVANTAADPAKLGAAGVSYGAGISILGAAADPRIRAVAMMSGWTDMEYSLYGEQTRRRQAPDLLGLVAQVVGRPSADMTTQLNAFRAGRDTPQVRAWGQVRSAVTKMDRLNASKPAVMIANAWGDSFFPPNQMIDFYNRYTGPKRLELRPGDHAIAELTGLAGLPNDVWTGVHAWFDQNLAGRPATPAPAVLVKPDNAPAETFQNWPGISTSTVRYGFGRIRALDGAGPLGGEPSTGWSKSLPTDRDTVAGGGVVLATNGAAAITGQRPAIWLPAVDRFRAGVWVSGRPSTVTKVRGMPKVHLNLTGTEASGSVVAYLYALDALGTARLITHAPASWQDTDGGDQTLDFPLTAAAYDVPAGQALALVVDTVDPLYYDENAPDKTVTIAGGSYVDVPMR